MSKTIFATLILVLFHSIAYCEVPRVLIFTDWLLDDQRAMERILSEPENAKQVAAIVATSGNSFLKAASTRSAVMQKGWNIPVFEGTSTNLFQNPSTEFAGNNTGEGSGFLDPADRDRLKSFQGINGEATSPLLKQFESLLPGQKMNISLLTAPTDLMKFIQANPKLASEKIGTIFGAGFFKVGKDGKITSPYNTEVDPQSVKDFYEFLYNNLQIKFNHMGSHVLQSVAGGGYVPNTPEGKNIIAKLEALTNKDRFSKALYKENLSYKRGWVDASTRQFDFMSAAQWVPASWSHDASYYIFDETVLRMAFMPENELAKLNFEPSSIIPVGDFSNLTNPASHNFQKSNLTSSNRFDLVELPKKWGDDTFVSHIDILESNPSPKPVRGAYDPIDFEEPKYKVHAGNKPEEPIRIKSEKFINPKVVVFKFSIDDWLGLAQLLNHGPSLAALEKGGIITEGFQTKKQAQILKRFLEEEGHSNISVAAGYEFTEEELNKARDSGKKNLEFERGFYTPDEKGKILGFDAFPYANLEDTNLTTPKKLLNLASANAKGKGIDAVVYGMGLDLADHLNRKIKAGKRGVFSSIMGMSGGREVNGAMAFARNLIIQSAKTLGFYQSAAEDGAHVTLFSSNEFGGNVSAKIPTGEENANVVLDKLSELKLKNKPAYGRVIDHWKHWSQGFAYNNWKPENNNGAARPLDPRDIVLSSLGTSPLGMRMAYENMTGLINGENSPYGSQKVDLRLLKEGQPLANAMLPKDSKAPGVYWPTRKLPVDPTELKKFFETDNEQLLQILARQLEIENSAEAIKYAEAVRLHGPFSKEAEGLTFTGNRSKVNCVNILGTKL